MPRKLPEPCSVETAERELRKESAVPSGLVDLMRDLARQIFYHKPKNVELFLAEYLERRLRKEKEKANGGQTGLGSYPRGDGCVNILGESMAANGTWQNNLLKDLQNKAAAAAAAQTSCDKGAASAVNDAFDDVTKNLDEANAKGETVTGDPMNGDQGQGQVVDPSAATAGGEQSGADGKDGQGQVVDSSAPTASGEQGGAAGKDGQGQGQVVDSSAPTVGGEQGGADGKDGQGQVVDSSAPAPTAGGEQVGSGSRPSGNLPDSQSGGDKLGASGGDKAAASSAVDPMARSQNETGARNLDGSQSDRSAPSALDELPSAIQRFFSGRSSGGPRPGSRNFYILLGLSALLGLAGVYFLIRSFDVDRPGWVPSFCGTGAAPHRYSSSGHAGGVGRQFGSCPVRGVD